MKNISQILLIVAIIVTALFGLGFGLCGVAGLVMTAESRGNPGAATMLIPWSLAGIAIAVGAGFFIYQVLWKAYRRRVRDDGASGRPGEG